MTTTKPAVETAVATRISDEKFAESGLVQALINRQLMVGRIVKSPMARTTATGLIKSRRPQIPRLKGFLGKRYERRKKVVLAPPEPKAGTPKEKSQKAGKRNVIDKFFNYINAILK